MQFSISARIMLGIALGSVASTTFADPIRFDSLVTSVQHEFSVIPFTDEILLDAAKKLFAALAMISLVWTMGLQIVRQDIGEALMELLRFIVVTGTLYWMLVNASTHAGGEGFVERIIASFFQMSNGSAADDSFVTYGDDAVSRALNVYLKVIGDTAAGDNADRIVGGLIGVIVLIALTLLAAQFLLAIIMAWLLGYGGIFLLGFGGARWTSQIAINYYKHVVALGIAILALGFIGLVSGNIFISVIPTYGVRGPLTYPNLGKILAISLLMLVLGLRVPQLLYTLVTGSALGIFSGTAGMVGSAIATGGGAALASATGRSSLVDGTSGASSGTVARSGSAMEAIERSTASVGAMADPFHVGGSSDPFGVPRRQDAYRASNGGSVFGAAGGGATAPTPSGSPVFTQTASSGVVGRVEGSSTSSVASVSGAYSESGSRYEVTTRGTETPEPGMDSREDGRAGRSRPDYLAEMTAIAAERGESTLQSREAAHQSGSAQEQLHASTFTNRESMTTGSAPDVAHTEGVASDSQWVTSTDLDSHGRMEVAGDENSVIASHTSQEGANARSTIDLLDVSAHEEVRTDGWVSHATLTNTSASGSVAGPDAHSVDTTGSDSTTMLADGSAINEGYAAAERDSRSPPIAGATEVTHLAREASNVHSAPAMANHAMAPDVEHRRSVEASPGVDAQQIDSNGVRGSNEQVYAGGEQEATQLSSMGVTEVVHLPPGRDDVQVLTSGEADRQLPEAASQTSSLRASAESQACSADAQRSGSTLIHESGSSDLQADAGAAQGTAPLPTTGEADVTHVTPEASDVQLLTSAGADADSPVAVRVAPAVADHVTRRTEVSTIAAAGSPHGEHVVSVATATATPTDVAPRSPGHGEEEDAP